MTFAVELEIWKEIAGRHLSPSHDRWHIDRVQAYALRLSEIYHADSEIVTAAVILHDLGRSDPTLRGVASAKRSVEIAREILNRTHLVKKEKIERILQAIAEHDQPEITPSTIEGRILKDADFLAGFGAWGILRIAIWAGETGEGVDQILDRLTNRMTKRLAYLEFPESRKIAIKEMSFARLFVSQLTCEPIFDKRQSNGRYIVIEGISGSGKDTQAEKIREHLEEKQIHTMMVHEPTTTYKQARELWEEVKDDPMVQTYLLIADRYKQFHQHISPALGSGITVITVRSFLSTIAYQGAKSKQMELFDYLHEFVPVPDFVFVLDLPPEIARKRVEDRALAQHRQIGSFEDIENLAKLRETYRQLVMQRSGEGYYLIDAHRPVEEVTHSILEIIHRGS